MLPTGLGHVLVSRSLFTQRCQHGPCVRSFSVPQRKGRGRLLDQHAQAIYYGQSPLSTGPIEKRPSSFAIVEVIGGRTPRQQVIPEGWDVARVAGPKGLE